jgi:hypothetical protein
LFLKYGAFKIVDLKTSWACTDVIFLDAATKYDAFFMPLIEL